MEKIEQIIQLFNSLSDSDKNFVSAFILKETQPKYSHSPKGIFVGPAHSSEKVICEKCGITFKKESKE